MGEEAGANMNIENTRRLIEAAPKLYGGMTRQDNSGIITPIMFGFECGDGWFDILLELSEKLEALGKGIEASQVKEKYGTLRFYVHGGTEEAYQLIQEAEKKSAKTCELCGKPARLRDVDDWCMTECDECFEK